jgi:hypothetical protein
MPLTSYSPTTISAALKRARQARDDERARAPEREIAAANAYLAGSSARGAEDFGQIIRGLERLAAENEYADIRAAIDAGADALNASDRQSAFSALHYRREGMEVDHPGIGRRYAQRRAS